MKELDELIATLEARIPASPSSPKNQKLSSELEQDIKRYFKRLEGMIPADRLEQIYYKYVEQE